MAFRTWARIMLAAFGVGALAGTSQLGLAYGLGIVRLTRVFDVTTRDQWTAQLAWVGWFAMVAAVIGALVGGHLVRRWAPPAPTPDRSVGDHPATGQPAAGQPAAGQPAGDQPTTQPPTTGGPGPMDSAALAPEGVSRAHHLGAGTAAAVAAAAGLGAAIVVPLTMQPARTAQLAGVDPVVAIATCTGLGVLLGTFAGVAALTHSVARRSLGLLVAAVWAAAIVSVLPSLGLADRLPAVRLGVFDAGFLAPGTTQRTALFTMPALALLAGAALGWAARREGNPPLVVALAGLPGPLLVTLAYLIAGPGDGAQRYQLIPYWAAMAATATGVLGSVLAAVLRRNEGDEPQADGASATAAPVPTLAPAADRPPLPRRRTGLAAPVAEPAPAGIDPVPVAGAQVTGPDQHVLVEPPGYLKVRLEPLRPGQPEPDRSVQPRATDPGSVGTRLDPVELHDGPVPPPFDGFTRSGAGPVRPGEPAVTGYHDRTAPAATGPARRDDAPAGNSGEKAENERSKVRRDGGRHGARSANRPGLPDTPEDLPAGSGVHRPGTSPYIATPIIEAPAAAVRSGGGIRGRLRQLGLGRNTRRTGEADAEPMRTVAPGRPHQSAPSSPQPETDPFWQTAPPAPTAPVPPPSPATPPAAPPIPATAPAPQRLPTTPPAPASPSAEHNPLFGSPRTSPAPGARQSPVAARPWDAEQPWNAEHSAGTPQGPPVPPGPRPDPLPEPARVTPITSHTRRPTQIGPTAREPRPVSAPLPQPSPVVPPLPAPPAPITGRPITPMPATPIVKPAATPPAKPAATPPAMPAATPAAMPAESPVAGPAAPSEPAASARRAEPAADAPAGRRAARNSPLRPQDEEYVDWVSGLSSD